MQKVLIKSKKFKKYGELLCSIHCQKTRKGRFWLQMFITVFGTKAMSNAKEITHLKLQKCQWRSCL